MTTMSTEFTDVMSTPQKEIVTKIDMSLGLMEQDERKLYYNLLKKTVSGTIDKNLIDLEFTTAQVEHSPEHKLSAGLEKMPFAR